MALYVGIVYIPLNFITMYMYLGSVDASELNHNCVQHQIVAYYYYYKIGP